MGVGQQLQVSGRGQVRLEMRGLREDVGPAFCAGGGDRRRRGAGGLRRWRRERDGVLLFLPLSSPPLPSPFLQQLYQCIRSRVCALPGLWEG